MALDLLSHAGSPRLGAGTGLELPCGETETKTSLSGNAGQGWGLNRYFVTGSPKTSKASEGVSGGGSGEQLGTLHCPPLDIWRHREWDTRQGSIL